MDKVIFTLLCIYFVFYYNKKTKHSWKTPSSFLIMLYLISLTCAIVDIYIGYDIPYILDDKYWGSTILFIILLLAFILPFISFREDLVDQFRFPSMRFLNISSTVLIGLSLAAILYYIPSIRSVFSYGSLSEARDDRYYYEVSFVETGLTYTFFSVISSLFIFCILLFFIYYIIGGHKVRCGLLLLGSFSETFHVLTEVGRDGIVFWLFTFLFFLFLFRNFISEKKLKFIKNNFLIVIGIISIPFILISVSRFSENVFAGIVSYMGQQFKHFCYYTSLENAPTSSGYIFPLFWEILGMDRPERAVFNYEFTDSGSFGTFMKSFIENISLIGTIIVSIVAGIFFKMGVGTIKRTMPLYTLILYIMYFEVYGQGVFYFRHYTRGGNLFIVLCVIGYMFFRVYDKSPNSVILNRVKRDKKNPQR